MPEYSTQLFRHLPRKTPRQTPNLPIGTFQGFLLPLFRQEFFGKHPVDIFLIYFALFLHLENQLADVSNLDDVHFLFPVERVI
jgi:hypothetical protein